MALPPIIAPFFTSVESTFTGFYLTGASSVAAAINPVFKTLVSLYVVLWGLAMWRGLIQEPMSDGITRIIKIVLIGSFALNVAVYSPRIADTLFKTPEQLSGVVWPTAGGPVASGTGAVLDAALDKAVSIAGSFTSAMSWSAPFSAIILAIYSFVVLLLAAVLIGYAAALIMLAKIGLSIVLAVGPIFIALLLFEATRGFFQGWLGQALNFLFTYVLAALVVALALTFFDSAASNALAYMTASGPDLVAALPAFLVGIATILVLKQVPGIASGLAGGVQLSTLGAVGWAMRSTGRALTSPARGFERYQRYKDRQLMRQHYRAQIDAAKGKSDDVSDQTLTDRLRGQNAVVRK